MYCSNCGTDAGNNKFCTECGAKIERPEYLENNLDLKSQQDQLFNIDSSDNNHSIDDYESANYDIKIISINKTATMSVSTYAIMEATKLTYWEVQKPLWNLPATLRIKAPSEKTAEIKTALDAVEIEFEFVISSPETVKSEIDYIYTNLHGFNSYPETNYYDSLNLNEKMILLAKQYGHQISEKYPFYVKDDIPSTLIDKSLKHFAFGLDRTTIVAYFDSSETHNGKIGYIFCDDRIYYKEFLEKPGVIYYSDINSISVVEKHNKKHDGYSDSLVFNLKNNSAITWSGLEAKKAALKTFLDAVVKTYVVESSDQLSDEVKSGSITIPKLSKKEAIDSIISDSDEIYDFVMGLPDDCDLRGQIIPDSLKMYLDEGKKDKNTQEAIIKSMGVTAALCGTSVALGSLPMAGLAVGIGALLPPILPFAIAGGISGLIAQKLISKKDVDERSAKAKKVIDKLSKAIEEKSSKYNENEEKSFTRFLSEKAVENAEIVKKGASHIAILLDDATHNNVNKRIQQYQQIVLDQYHSQKQLANQFSEIVKEYNRLLEENKELQEEIRKLQQILNGVNANSSFFYDAG